VKPTVTGNDSDDLETVAARPKGIFILPSLFTTAGLFAGFYAIVQATKGVYDNAAIGLFFAMVMDGLDGRIARLTNTASDFGKEYDSLVDVICFGLAPALVVYEWALFNSGKLGWLVAFLYVSATALRLARFNTQDVADKRYFLGLPCPSAAALMASMVWLMDVEGAQNDHWRILAILIPVLTALSMVSNLPYRSFKDLDLKGRIPFIKTFFIVLGVTIIFYDPPRVLFILSLLYFLSGPLTYLHQRHRQRCHSLADDDG